METFEGCVDVLCLETSLALGSTKESFICFAGLEVWKSIKGVLMFGVGRRVSQVDLPRRALYARLLERLDWRFGEQSRRVL